MKAAAEQDHPEALYELSLTRFGPHGDHVLNDARHKLLIRAAELGTVAAQRDVAVLYIWGDNPSFERDWSKARFWYLQVARKGHQESQLAVGSMIVRGDGGPVNQEEGLALLELAANGPDSYEAKAAAEELASYYSGAFGVPPDRDEGYIWRERVKSTPVWPLQVWVHDVYAGCALGVTARNFLKLLRRQFGLGRVLAEPRPNLFFGDSEALPPS